ncbi:MAG: class I SAM-dependent methyltransferase [Candidatus Omnitrophica bacterium]|nr:class I SAM-dependent methyltransferase [Candidatus Omnitrophota bacterium]
MKALFNKYYKKYDYWYDNNKFAYFSEIEALRKAIPPGRGLEIGVGTGRFAASLEIAIGVDPSLNMLKIARRRGVNVCLGFGEGLPFFDNTFDYAAIIITLCFVDNPLKVLQEAGRVLKKDGRVILGIIDKDSFLGRFYRKKKSLFYKQARFFGVEELKDLLKVAGFNTFSYYQTLFELPGKMKSVEKPCQGFGKGGFVVISSLLG